MEERQVIRSYKFGVEKHITEFKKFMAFLGETIDLSGWRGYRAGLDVSGANNTGIQSVYTKWQGYEIMYHDGKDTFDLCSIASHQNHVVALVTPEGEGYRIQISAKNGVPAFTPDIPDPPLLLTDAVSRDFFLHKLVNAERASYKSPSFAPKLSRTRSVLLYDLAVKFLG
ncbi:hypothetical protein BASA60_000923 [Batrachochytrium salamandrivorans]|nr:hypothetical protein BASA60_000923 [Batrachochytrium salamandrivorans]